jgi:hypothetical protein
MSMTPPETSRTLSPRSGIRTSAASPAPIIEPKVFTLYTAPTARSPLPAFSSIRVISGSVIPAQNVAGSITASAMPYFATVKRSYPSGFWSSPWMRKAIQSNESR